MNNTRASGRLRTLEAPTTAADRRSLAWRASLTFLAMIACIGAISSAAVYWSQALVGAAIAAAALGLARRHGGRSLAAIPEGRFLAAVVAVALAVRLAAVLLTPYTATADFQVYRKIAAGLTSSGRYGWSAEGSYRCLLPPGQVFSLAMLQRVFGECVRGGQILNVIYSALSVLCVLRIGTLLFSAAVGRAAAILAALLPSTVFGCVLIGAEAPQTFWFLAGMCFYLSMPARGWTAALLCGACMGVAALIRPTFVLPPLLLGLYHYSLVPLICVLTPLAVIDLQPADRPAPRLG